MEVTPIPIDRKTKDNLIADNVFDGVYLLDRDRTIHYWNRGAERLTGYAAHEVIGKSCADNILMHVDDQGKSLCLSRCPAAAAMAEDTFKEAEVYLHHRDGHRVPVSIRVVPLKNEKGEIIGAVEVFGDNTSKVNLIETLKRMESAALLDPLTQIANRRMLENHIQSKIKEAKRYGWLHGLFFLDIDDFKKVNDTYGHAAGDAVLKMVAQTLVKNSRPFDIIGRWGGRGVHLNSGQPKKLTIAERYRSLVENSQIELKNSSSPLKVTVSVGATLFRRDDTIESLIERADQLMYQSKLAGKNWVSVDP